MNQRLQLGLLSAALLCAVPLSTIAQTVHSGPSISHVPIPGDFSPDSADQYLNNRLQEQNAADVLKDIVKDPSKYGITDKDQELLKKAGGDPQKALQDPNIQKIIRHIGNTSRNQKAITDDEREKLQRIIDKLPPALLPNKPNPLTTPPDKPLPPPTNDPAKPPSDSHPKPPEAPPMTGPNGNSAPPVPPSPPSSPPNSPVKNDMHDIAEWLADSRFADSPAFRRMILNLDRLSVPEGPGFAAWDQRMDRIGDRLAKWGSHLPDFSWPKFGSSPRGPGRRSGPSVSPTEATEGNSSVLLLLLAVAAVALIVWAMLRRSGLGLLRRTETGWRLGPWPVRPDAVRTRDDLVRAFEYLALLRFGLAARSQNHREIADSLAEYESHHRAAAERLAGLYEQARYAPPDEALPDAELAAARADLSLLAGVAAA
jgi:hypothetical protein